MPRVSVILPNYNYARYLKERVRSIVQQSMTDLELIYLDDASKDESNLVMQSFAGDPRLQMHLFSENSGKVYQRWNDGAALATGEWLWFAGADDTAHPAFLEHMLQLADAHPTAGLLHCQIMLIDGEGRLLSLKFHELSAHTEHMETSHFAAGYEEGVRLTEANYLSTASAVLIRRDAFEKAGAFDIRLWQVADWSLYLSVLNHHDIAFLAEPLVCYRSHAQTVTNTTKPSLTALESAVTVARAYKWITADPRCTTEAREKIIRRLRALLFEVYVAPDFVVPAKLGFAAEEIYDVVPDKRLLNVEKTPA